MRANFEEHPFKIALDGYRWLFPRRCADRILLTHQVELEEAMIEGGAMDGVLAQLAERYELVVIDTAPMGDGGYSYGPGGAEVGAGSGETASR